MANKDLFKQAIAEAKSIRETAIANAKEALEESLTPHLKDMLAAKLQEMEDSKVEEETVNEEEVEEAVEETVTETEDIKEDEVKEESKEVTEVEVKEEDEVEDAEEEPAEDEADVEIDSEESEDEAEGDEELSNLSVDQFKDIIRDIIAQEMGPAGEEELPAPDMDAGEEMPAADIEMGIPGDGESEEEEIDLDELLQELEGTVKEDEVKKEVTEVEVKEDEVKKEEVVNEEEVKEEKSELDSALKTIETLQKELNEVNILNAKLLYVNRIFKSNDLNESQKVNIIAAFDKAETVKEVKLVYETVSENVVAKKKTTTVKEGKLGRASRATGTTGNKPEVISEVSSAVLRMQKLAGII